MFSGFDLCGIKFEDDEINQYYQKGLSHFQGYKSNVQSGLEQYICENGVFSGTKMQEDWFPQVNADIFLSHSHKDEKTVIALAGWLNDNFGLRVFIDSCIWGYAPDLLKIIDDEYCVSNKDGDHTTYNYEKRNYSTSHVYMMLSVALSKMIDKVECLIFYNTPASMTTKESINSGSTKSPWIYHELQTSKLIRHRPLLDYRKLTRFTKEHRAMMEHTELSITYDVTLEHLTNIDADDLTKWEEAYLSCSHPYPLDVLYSQTGLLGEPLYG